MHRIAPVALIVPAVILFSLVPAHASPVVCQNQPSDLFDVSLNGPTTLTLLDGSATIEYNNMGYRSLDEKLYAVEITSTGTTGKIVRMNTDGSGITLLSTTGALLATTIRYDAGDVNNDLDVMYISNTGGNTLFTLDLQTLVMSSAGITGDLGLVADWAYYPDDGLLYSVDSQGQLAVLDPVTAVRTDYAVAGGGMPSGEVFGAVWYDSDLDDLFVYRNTPTGPGNSVYQIDPGTKTRLDQWSAPATEVNDGAYVPNVTSPTSEESWGAVKALFR
jgi:hypothetical protein